MGEASDVQDLDPSAGQRLPCLDKRDEDLWQCTQLGEALPVP